MPPIAIPAEAIALFLIKSLLFVILQFINISSLVTVFLYWLF